MGGAMLALALLLGVGIGVYTHATLLPYVLKNERFEWKVYYMRVFDNPIKGLYDYEFGD